MTFDGFLLEIHASMTLRTLLVSNYVWNTPGKKRVKKKDHEADLAKSLFAWQGWAYTFPMCVFKSMPHVCKVTSAVHEPWPPAFQTKGVWEVTAWDFDHLQPRSTLHSNDQLESKEWLQRCSCKPRWEPEPSKCDNARELVVITSRQRGHLWKWCLPILLPITFTCKIVMGKQQKVTSWQGKS